jgi:CubicO group peptidase (beta-lactamase class C family)
MVVVVLSLAAVLTTPYHALIALVPAAEAAVREAAATPPLPLATPESQGMSPDRLSRLHTEIGRFVTEGKHAGAVTLLARNGRIVDWRTFGKRDIEAGLPMEKDTICRIFSMSKIITSVAVLSLLEEARFRLDDPIADYLPQFARMKVLIGGTAEKPLLADARKPITIRHLLTHTSGLTYDFGDGTLDKIFWRFSTLAYAAIVD